MGRPPLAVGTTGDMICRQDGDRWKARVYVRDADGKRREVTRWAKTDAAAKAALRSALRDRTDPTVTSGTVRPETRLSALAERWITDVDASSIASNSKRLYRLSIDNHILPALGGLQLREISVPRADEALRVVAQRSGPGTAKTMRTVLSGILGTAVRLGAMPTNPIRDTGAISRATKKDIRALTLDEQDRVMDAPRASKRALELDIPDLIDWMLATGMRIGEALAIRESVLDLDAGTVEVNATVIRIKGVGLVVQERPKTAAGWRVLALPVHLVEMLKLRRQERAIARAAGAAELVKMLSEKGVVSERGNVGVVFTSPTGKLRDPSNTNADLRETLDQIDRTIRPDGTAVVPFGWATSHVFRKTVATRLDEAGFSARQIADVLGHSHPSMTQDVYMGRKVVSAEAAKVLTRRGPSLLPTKA